MSDNPVREGRNLAAITDRTFVAIFNGTGLEPVLDRDRSRVGSFRGGDETWSVQVHVALLPEHHHTGPDEYSIAIGGETLEGYNHVVLIEGDESVSAFWAVASLVNDVFTPERGWRDASVVDILYEGVRIAAPIILERAAAR